MIRAGRSLKADYEIPPAKKVKYYIQAVDKKNAEFLQQESECLIRMMNAEDVEIGLTEHDASDGLAPSKMANAGTIYLPLAGLIDIEAEMQKLDKQKKQIVGWIKGSEAKLSNEKFVANAPEQVVADARTHLVELKDKLSRVDELIASLKG